MESNSKNLIPLALATAVLLMCAGSSTTASADALGRWERVKFDDLNVGTKAGVQKLYTRIHTAAERVCSESDPILRLSANACINKAEKNAVEKINLVQLTAYYNNKTKSGDHSQPRLAAR